MTDVATRSPVDEVADRFWDGFLELQPVYATMIGDERWSDRLNDPGPEGRAREVALLRDVERSAAAIDRSGLGVEDRITLDMLEVLARINLALHEQGLWQLEPVNQMAGPQTVPGDLARIQRADTPERFEKLLARLADYPRFIEANIGVMREGQASGRTAARPVVERTLEQVRRLLETPVDQLPLMVGIPGLEEEQRQRLRATLEEYVTPSRQRLSDALREYLEHARPGDRLWAIPGGDEAYRTLILAYTTLEEDPQDLHDYGLAQIEAIDRERAAIARSLGFDDVAALRRALDEDPTNKAQRPEGLVEQARAQVERAESAAPRYFGRLPRARCEVRPVEAYQEREAAGAFYIPPAGDGSRGGIYYINTYDPASRPLHRLAAITFHEATPGHHFQISIETELEGLHPFRRLGSRLVGVAFPEGWGLYSERLADEMALYADERERFGMLDTQAWRAARLVVDTGLHRFRWDRQRAVDFLVETGLTRLEAETETDRYISWPGQALAYMVGQREISSLRAQLAERDGDRFDLRGFHDAVLGHGSLPLATLRRELPGWVRPRES